MDSSWFEFPPGWGVRPSIGYGGEYGNYTDPETGLLCLCHRYYDPGTDRFLNRNPIGYAGGINLYGYAGNNPVNEVDPEGTDWILSWNDFWADLGGGLKELPRALELGIYDVHQDPVGKWAFCLIPDVLAMKHSAAAAGAASEKSVAWGKVALLSVTAVGTAMGAGGAEERVTAEVAPETSEFAGGIAKAFKPRPPGMQFHHMPAASVTPESFHNGTGILMETLEHMKTKSWGLGPEQDAYRAAQKALIDAGKRDDAVQMDIDDIQNLFGNKYDDAILKMINKL